MADENAPSKNHSARWRLTGCVAVVVVATLTVAYVLNNRNSKATPVAIVTPPRLVETIGVTTPLGDYGKEQSAVSTLLFSVGSGDNTKFPDSAGAYPERGRLKVFWKNGTLPPSARTEAERASQYVPVDVYATKYSQAELKDALNKNSPRLFKLGACSAGAAIGVDSLQFTTDKDPKALKFPAATSEGIPIQLTQGPCPEAT